MSKSGFASSPDATGGGGDTKDDIVTVEVAYARPERQLVLPVDVPSGSTIRAAIETSGILRFFPEIDLETQAVGLFGCEMDLDDPISAGERVEIYRPLAVDPKERRRAKAMARARS